MLKLIRESIGEIRKTRRKIRDIEARKRDMEQRSRVFIRDRKASSDIQRRIDDMREAIQHKPQSDR